MMQDMSSNCSCKEVSLHWGVCLARTMHADRVSLDAGKWCKHVDAWDCLKDQEFPSLEGFAFVAQQMFQLGKPPNRYTPEFQIWKKYKEWEIRRYMPHYNNTVACRCYTYCSV